MEERTFNIRCGQTEYTVAGEGKPVLVIHGNAGGFDQGLDLAAENLGKEYKAIVPSRFGYLWTPLPEDATPCVRPTHTGVF